MTGVEMRFSRIPRRALRRQILGLSLLELMIALALGLLLSAGILTLFDGTSRTNKLQNGLARLQENGRFAVTRMESDLRMMGGQYCSNNSGASVIGASVPVVPVRAPMVYAPQLLLPDPGPDAGGGSLALMNSAVGGYPSAAAATEAYALSPRFFVQGYACDSGDCTSGLPSDMPAEGLAVGARVPGSDVLTVRYQRGTGWPLLPDGCALGGAPVTGGGILGDGATMTVEKVTGDDPISGMTAGLALISDCVNSNIVPISAVADNVLTVGVAPSTASGILPEAPGSICMVASNRDVRVFNFSTDFVTVTYYLGFREDESPGARPNSAAAVRLIPVLVRRENGEDQELVRGIDELRFRYGVQDISGSTRFLDATELEASAATSCPPPPAGVLNEPNCLWRAVRTVEARLLVNTVDEVFGLDEISRSYHFDGDDASPTDDALLPSGLRAGSMLRREFIAYASNRNYNF